MIAAIPAASGASEGEITKAMGVDVRTLEVSHPDFVAAPCTEINSLLQRSEHLPVRHHCPNDPCQFVGPRNRNNHRTSSLQQCVDPRAANL